MLHTSDWHLGRTFHGASLIDEQRAVVERVTALAADHNVDLVVIAGDLFDRAIPPAEAVTLFDDALAALHATGATVVAIAGNHDSATRVAVNDRLLERAGVTIRGHLGRLLEPVVLHPDDGGSPVAVYPIPYLEPSIAGPQLALLAGEAEPTGAADATDPVDSHGRQRRLSHHDVTARALDLVRGHATSIGPVRTIVVAHTFVAGGTTSESERDLSIGNIDLVDVSAFEGIDLVALGHLHGPQTWDDGRIAYSGTPLPYSFSEQDHVKSVRLVDLPPVGPSTAQIVPLGVGRPLRTLRGALDDLLTNPAFDDAVEARLRVELTDRDLPLQAMTRLQRRFPHAAVLQHLPGGGHAAAGAGDVTRALREAASPLQLAERFWEDQHGVEVADAQRQVLHDALTAVGAEEQA